MRARVACTDPAEAKLGNIFGLRRDTGGTTAVEYALIAGLIAVVIAVAVTTTGSNLAGLYNSVVASY